MNSKKIVKIATALIFIATMLCGLNMVSASMTVPTAVAPASVGGLTSIVGKVIYIVQYICYAVAFIMLLYLGAKYVSAAPDGKAEIKKTAVQYVIGAALVFAAGAIIGIIQNLINSAASTT